MNPTNTAKETYEKVKALQKALQDLSDMGVELKKGISHDVLLEIFNGYLSVYRDCCLMQEALERYAGEDEIEAYSEEGRWAAKTLSQVSTYPLPND